MNYGKRLFTGLAIILTVLVGFFVYNKFFSDESAPPSVVTTPPPSETGESLPTTEEPTSESETTTLSLDDLKNAIDTESIRPNELGEIMILMYHRIGDEDTEYDRSVESFKKDLEVLYKNGFRTVSMQDYIDSHFDIPAGTTPVVLTFDDGDPSHFRVARNDRGELIPDPNCAVGILDAFSKEHPDFGRNAIFYLNAYAFGEPEYLEWKLRYLLENGYETGNHTFGHEFLNSLDARGVQESIGKNVSYYKNLVPEIEMNSIALPYGILPVEELEHYVVAGEYRGQQYENKVALLVGWRPTWPLYTAGIHPEGINRVQCGSMEFQMYWWLDIYESAPENRYISDGVPEIITIPRSWEAELDTEKVDMERVHRY